MSDQVLISPPADSKLETVAETLDLPADITQVQPSPRIEPTMMGRFLYRYDQQQGKHAHIAVEG